MRALREWTDIVCKSLIVYKALVRDNMDTKLYGDFLCCWLTGSVGSASVFEWLWLLSTTSVNQIALWRTLIQKSNTFLVSGKDCGILLWLLYVIPPNPSTERSLTQKKPSQGSYIVCKSLPLFVLPTHCFEFKSCIGTPGLESGLLGWQHSMCIPNSCTIHKYSQGSSNHEASSVCNHQGG